ncbi:hypothetical protein [uncultured Bacteroides sp.]|uniref:hypothetical protein n=1 Tax=uncultured Bacteroides sp. TaxID=162156 RepID=UPI0025D07C27|nr:hypothetical protein [uncultured Bacteroides sp.]
MKTIYYTLICFTLFAAESTQGYAQKETARRNEHFVDLAFGAELNTSSYKSAIGEIAFQGKKRAFVSMLMRYQYFFHKHWGVSLSLNSGDCSPYSTERLMSKMEKQPLPYYYTYNGSLTDEDSMQSTYTIGAMYRQDIKSWSFRPYMALGCALYSAANTIDYLCKEEGNNQVEQVKVTFGNGKRTQSGFCFSPGIYISKAIARIVSLTADLSYTVHTRKFTAHYQRSNIYTQEILEQYSVKETSGNYLSLKVGLSIRFARDKNGRN